MATRFIKAKDIASGDLIVWSFDGVRNKHSTLALFRVNKVVDTFRVVPSHSPDDGNHEVLVGNGVSLFGDRLLDGGGANFNKEYWLHENRAVVLIEED
jgi:hypothetical protein